MKKGKHTEEQIIGVLKQVEAGRTVKDVAEIKKGLSIQPTYFSYTDELLRLSEEMGHSVSI